MAGQTVQQMAEEVAALLHQRLGLRGAGLGAKLRSGGRLLPRRVRVAAQQLQAAAELAEHPKLALRVDHKAATAAHRICVQHLGGIDHKYQRTSRRVGLAGSIAFSLLVVAGLFGAVLVWRGFL